MDADDPFIRRYRAKRPPPPPRRRVRPLDLTALTALDDENLIRTLYRHTLARTYLHGEPRDATYLALRPGLRAIFTTCMLHVEVCNGGFHQYFWNTLGLFATEAVLGFELFGDRTRTLLVREAIIIAHEETPLRHRLRTKRNMLQAYLESLRRSELPQLDPRYYATEPALEQLQIAAVRARPELFVTVPPPAH